ncbi:PIG-L family deacetylase [Humibacter soli]
MSTERTSTGPTNAERVNPMRVDPFATVRTVLLAHAHPDDETLSSGGLIRELVSQGIRVDLLTATRGERGEVVSELRHEFEATSEIDAEALTARRMDELSNATRVLGIHDVLLLGDPPARVGGLPPRRYLDSGMRWITPTLAGPSDDVPPEALTAAPLTDVIADITATIAYVAPDLVISYDDQGGYGHPDHRRVREAALAAARSAGVPFAELVDGDSEGAWRVDATSRLPEVQQALRAHATQLTVDGTDVVHSGGQREPIRTVYGVRLVPLA